ncbi:MAG: Kdo hydroxylase family protein [Gammaproteobacteria bacterium]|nr:Kdo hydroxylase family protein [Gammaproteobacteria bacterium]
MLATYTREQIESAGKHGISDALERGSIVHFPDCPIELPPTGDLEFLRERLPEQLKLKNISYHPEADRVRGIEGDPAIVTRVHRILTGHSRRVEAFLQRIIPSLARDWTVGTVSFRPIEEQGRNLDPHASNELVHIDAGAYGATNGDRIFRFFVNVHPHEDRVWASKGRFPELYERYGHEAGIDVSQRRLAGLAKGPLDHARTRLLRGLEKTGLPMARMLDSSPYDRLMRRFHNFMKDTPAFQQSMEGHVDLRFKPFSAWMVFTDMVSHASVSGRYALVNTNLVPLANCRLRELAPYNILQAA